jgi:hypothetical protein
MSSNRAQLCSLAWAEESWVTRSLEIVVRFAGASLCRGLFVSMKIAHNRVVRSGCDDGHLNLPVTAMSSCPVAGVATTSRERCPRWGARVGADLHGNGRMTESPELRAESADLRVLTLVTGRELRLRACLSDGFRSRMGEAHERSELALDGLRETSVIVRRWFGERASPRTTQVPSSQSSRWPTAALPRCSSPWWPRISARDRPPLPDAPGLDVSM